MLDVLVVGCGVSGISCAKKLLDNGVNVKIIEAKSVVGGRTSTVVFDKGIKPLYFNKGAAWIHKPRDNPIVPILDHYGITTKKNCGQVGFLDHLYFPNSNELTEKERDEVEILINNLKKRYEEIKLELSEGKSAEDVLNELLNSSKILSDQYYNQSRVSCCVRWLLEQIGQYESSTLKDISSQSFSLEFGKDVAVTNDEIDHVVVTYEDLVKKIAKEFPIDSIILNNPVIKIDYSNNEYVEVLTQSNNIFKAKKVIVTCSLGILKANKIHFNPPLPQNKQNAIKNIGFGMMNKVILQFSEAFWDPNCHSFGIISEPIRIPYWLNHLKICGDNVIVGFMAGEFPLQTQVENWSNEKILEYSLELLSSCFPGVKLQDKLIDYYITRWENDEWILGSYSYIHKNTSLEDFIALNEPIQGKVFFAGEHTSNEDIGYVHGALKSGLNVASKILGEHKIAKL